MSKNGSDHPMGRPRLMDASLARALMIAVAALTMVFHPARAETIQGQFSAFTQGSAATVDHAAWNELLAKYIVAGSDGLNRVAYGKFKTEGHAQLKAYVTALERVDPATLDRPEQFAFWANLYNAKTIDIVLDHYPVKSIKDISLGGSFTSLFTGGPWKSKVVKVSGTPLSLDDIEHGLLRKVFKDPRVHYAVNCASIGCPNLNITAFVGATLEMQLDAAAQAYVNSPRGVRVASGNVKASSIYKWFSEDFGDSDRGVLDHISRYAAPELKSALDGVSTISGYAYDWALNDIN
ncbi:MAG: DUF547 domain-containing protein [Alphaproteobacteria bacterium]|nr:DUF547 domain-containing protein [Alphaproteobacteria bacterium]